MNVERAEGVVGEARGRTLPWARLALNSGVVDLPVSLRPVARLLRLARRKRSSLPPFFMVGS
jgi:hypothetical protein